MFLVTKLIHVHKHNCSHNYFIEHLSHVRYYASSFLYIVSFSLLQFDE